MVAQDVVATVRRSVTQPATNPLYGQEGEIMAKRRVVQ